MDSENAQRYLLTLRNICLALFSLPLSLSCSLLFLNEILLQGRQKFGNIS